MSSSIAHFPRLGYGPARSVMRHVWPHVPHVISITVGPSTTIRDRRIRDVTLRLPHVGQRPGEGAKRPSKKRKHFSSIAIGISSLS